MSNAERHTTDFKLISYKRGKKSSTCKILPTSYETDSSKEEQQNRDVILRRVQEAKIEIKASDIFASAVASLREGAATLSHPALKEIICFGLGRIGECMISRYQFAFLLCLKDLYNVSVKVYDPIFTENDCWLLNHFDCDILEKNCEGKYKVEDKCTRIFYMPHCPKQLTNNLLWANWGLNLNYCIIVANSFNSIIENTPMQALNKSGEFIVNIVPHMVELALINSFRLYEIFNDTAIHIFPWNKLKLLADDFWSFNSEPNYSDDDVELITNKFQSELIH